MHLLSDFHFKSFYHIMLYHIKIRKLSSSLKFTHQLAVIAQFLIADRSMKLCNTLTNTRQTRNNYSGQTLIHSSLQSYPVDGYFHLH